MVAKLHAMSRAVLVLTAAAGALPVRGDAYDCGGISFYRSAEDQLKRPGLFVEGNFAVITGVSIKRTSANLGIGYYRAWKLRAKR